MENTKFKMVKMSDLQVELIRTDGTSVLITDIDTAVTDLSSYFRASKEEINRLIQNREEIHFIR